MSASKNVKAGPSLKERLCVQLERTATLKEEDVRMRTRSRRRRRKNGWMGGGGGGGGEGRRGGGGGEKQPVGKVTGRGGKK